MCLFDIFNKDNDHITIILTSSYANSFFSKKRLSKTVKMSDIPSNSPLCHESILEIKIRTAFSQSEKFKVFVIEE